jgi:hypothetical protein
MRRIRGTIQIRRRKILPIFFLFLSSFSKSTKEEYEAKKKLVCKRRRRSNIKRDLIFSGNNRQNN